MSRATAARRAVAGWVAWAALAAALGISVLAPAGSARAQKVAGPADPPQVVATGVSRPLQLARRGADLLVLSPGARVEAAGEIVRLPLGHAMPVDLTGEPRTRVPFASAGARTFGSLAVDPASGALFLGEENGSRVWRLEPGGRFALYVAGLRRLPAGSTLLFDGRGRLVLVDYADPYLSQSDDRPPPGLEHLREEEYRGPVVLRLTLDDGFPLPRRAGAAPPLFPRSWSRPAAGALAPHLVAAAALGDDDLALLSSTGELFRLGGDGHLQPMSRLPRGEYNRASMVADADGTLFVSGGFHSGSVFRVAPDGAVAVVAAGLADPGGIALGDGGWLYIAESALHRVLRVRAR